MSVFTRWVVFSLQFLTKYLRNIKRLCYYCIFFDALYPILWRITVETAEHMILLLYLKLRVVLDLIFLYILFF